MSIKIPKVEQVYVRWWLWECAKAGMYDAAYCCTHDFEVFKVSYAEFLSDSQAFYNAAVAMTHAWPMSCQNFLTNANINRIAWIGQASACFEIGLSSAFRSGFWLLTQQQQDKANSIAAEVLRDWIIEYERSQKEDHAVRELMDKQMLLGWASR